MAGEELFVDDLVLDEATSASPTFLGSTSKSANARYEQMEGSDKGMPDASGMPTGQMPVQLNAEPLYVDDLVITPFDRDDDVFKYDSLGVEPNTKLPILNVQGVDWAERLLTQLPFDSAEDKAAFLKSRLGNGYDFAQHPTNTNDIILKKKGAKEWRVIDPDNVSIDELVPEAMENMDTLVQMGMLPASIASAGAWAGGVQATRQLLKKALLPSSKFDTGQVLMETGVAMVSQGLAGQAVNAAKGASKKAAGKAGQWIEDSTNEGGLLNKLGKRMNHLDSPDAIMTELKASSKQFDPEYQYLLKDKISTLQREFPEFMEAYRGGYTLKGKYDAAKQLADDAMERIASVQTNDSMQIPIKEILSSDSYQKAVRAARTRVVDSGKKIGTKVDRKTVTKIKNARKAFLEDMGHLVLKGNFGDKMLTKFMKGEIPEDKFVELIAEESVTLPELVMLRLGKDAGINFNKKAGQISTMNTVDKFFADAVRESIHKSALDNLGEAGEQFVRDLKLFHNLKPVVSQMGKAVGKKEAGEWNPVGKYWPGLLNSAPRFAAKIGVNLNNSVEVRNFAAKLMKDGFPMPGINGNMSKQLKGMQQLGRGARFGTLKGLVEQNFGEEAEAQGLPRDVNAYFEDPNLINELAQNLGGSDEVTQAVRMFARGDKDAFANTLSLFANENEDLFEKAPYKSLVMQNGKPVIMDKYEREQYRQFLTKTIVDPTERYEALQALNMNNEMTVKPFEPLNNIQAPTKKGSEAPRKGSTLSAVSSALKRSDVVELDDGTERVDSGF